MSGLEQAIAIAVSAHAGQRDKNGEPYILHPLRVMLSLSDETDRIVGVLHDVLEDSNLEAEIVDQGFSQEIIAALVAVTRSGGERYKDFITRAKQNDIARRVKIADIKDNLRPGAEHLRERYLKALAELEAS